jgi:hypothetical protein
VRQLRGVLASDLGPICFAHHVIASGAGCVSLQVLQALAKGRRAHQAMAHGPVFDQVWVGVSDLANLVQVSPNDWRHAPPATQLAHGFLLGRGAFAEQRVSSLPALAPGFSRTVLCQIFLVVAVFLGDCHGGVLELD